MREILKSVKQKLVAKYRENTSSKEVLKTVKQKLVAKYLENTNSKNTKRFKPRIKARIRKNKHLISKNINSLFDWVKGAQLIELKECNTDEDPVRPELDNTFRRSYGRKIFGVKYGGEIHAVMCFAYTNQIPKDVEELDKLSHDAYLQSAQRDQNVGKIAIAYTVWSKKKGGGKLIVKEVYKKIKKSNHLNRLVTLSPLTEMASKFHTRNGAKLLQVNETTQNFEYKIL
tara:strand:+ start:426 stop:1112 length:687 start_codon:yes stop_codon:yes gene_type:complete